jgi:hypothetical protein
LPLTGEYCSGCGQRERGADIRLADLAGEAFEELARLDGRVWRTLIGLVFKPGVVTADYLAGHRARYIPPLRLYLVVSFLVFLVISLTPPEIYIATAPDFDVDSARDMERGLYVPVKRADGSRENLALSEYLQEQEETGGMFGLLDEDANLPAWLRDWIERFRGNVSNIEEAPGDFVDLLLQRLPQMMFFLLPLFAVLLQLGYLWSPFHYLQHFVFSLHYHTAAYLLYVMLWPVRFVLPGDFGGVVMLFLLIYLPVALVRVYGSGKLAALVKGLAIGFMYYFLVFSVSTLYILINLALL